MNQREVENEYFEWMYKLISGDRFADGISYKKLMQYLYDTPFRWSIRNDVNRAEDGIDLRRRFSIECGFDSGYLSSYLESPCSVLEMLIALAIRCEETIMDDPAFGNRTGQWFWKMITNLKLGGMTDARYDHNYVEERINIFLDRTYEPDGTGGLFVIPNCEDDLRNVEIWIQLLWYLDNIS